MLTLLNRYIYRLKNYPAQKFREWVSKSIDYDAVLVGSTIETLKGNIQCLKGNHNWDNWSSHLRHNVHDAEELSKRGEATYSYRSCHNIGCGMEMPESRMYHGDNAKKYENGKNARSYENRFT